MKAREAQAQFESWSVARAAVDPAALLVEFRRMEQCETSNGSVYPAENGPCAATDGYVPLPDCGGFTPLLHL
ncbi:hypothetical protein ACGIF2_17485, partial [Cellulomonas sp. P22]|uniref:hypothetical protein n=1 Tax=Cellulomonas sp. P22 TaxID=3373189 RepID=UPI003791F97F